jgi:hypothetical protein
MRIGAKAPEHERITKTLVVRVTASKVDVRNLKVGSRESQINLRHFTNQPWPRGKAMKLLKRFFGSVCLHRFTWPRVDANGSHYQRCMRCGTAYEYDWRMMHRTNRVLAAITPNASDLGGNPGLPVPR